MEIIAMVKGQRHLAIVGDDQLRQADREAEAAERRNERWSRIGRVAPAIFMVTFGVAAGLGAIADGNRENREEAELNRAVATDGFSLEQGNAIGRGNRAIVDIRIPGPTDTTGCTAEDVQAKVVRDENGAITDVSAYTFEGQDFSNLTDLQMMTDNKPCALVVGRSALGGVRN